MSDKDKAEDLANKAIDKAVEGDEARARELAEKAKALDPDAAKAVSDEAAEDASQGAAYQKKRD